MQLSIYPGTSRARSAAPGPKVESIVALPELFIASVVVHAHLGMPNLKPLCAVP